MTTLMTPFAEAAEQGFCAGVEFLVSTRLGIKDANSTNKYRAEAKEFIEVMIPLDLAIRGGHVACVALLKQHGALTFEELNGNITRSSPESVWEESISDSKSAQSSPK
jgi:hypothetical protein